MLDGITSRQFQEWIVYFKIKNERLEYESDQTKERAKAEHAAREGGYF